MSLDWAGYFRSESDARVEVEVDHLGLVVNRIRLVVAFHNENHSEVEAQSRNYRPYVYSHLCPC